MVLYLASFLTGSRPTAIVNLDVSTRAHSALSRGFAILFPYIPTGFVLQPNANGYTDKEEESSHWDLRPTERKASHFHTEARMDASESTVSSSFPS